MTTLQMMLSDWNFCNNKTIDLASDTSPKDFLETSQQKSPWDFKTMNLQIQELGVSKNRGTPKWMVYNEKPY